MHYIAQTQRFAPTNLSAKFSIFPPFSNHSIYIGARVETLKKIERMPLLGGKRYNLQPPPDDLKPEEEIFVVKATNEVCRSYEYPLRSHITIYLQIQNVGLRPVCECDVFYFCCELYTSINNT